MKNVEIYTSDTCIQCIKAKEYLKNRNVEFKEYNISKDLEAKRELVIDKIISYFYSSSLFIMKKLI